MQIILYAIPGFFILMALELAIDLKRKTGYYRLNDAIASLSIGMLSRVVTVIKTLIPLSIYGILVEDVAVYSWPDSWLFWVGAFVLYDFLYYWNHRLGHEMSVLWAAHVVHHSSEEYNLTTALRQTSGSVLNWLFFIPLAFLGIPLELMLSIAALNLVYQFWVHTRHVGRLGILDGILVTPSNHRVHHAQNDIYIDKNYGGVFIIWDRMFGTFQPELDEQPPIYGIRTPLRSWNPIWSNWHVYRQLISDSRATVHWRDKLKVWFGRTGWRPDDVLAKLPPKKPFNPDTFSKFDVSLSFTTKGYALLQLALAICLTLSLLTQFTVMSFIEQLFACLALVVTLSALGGILENKSWAFSGEVFKWFMVLAMSVLLPVEAWAQWSIIGLLLTSLLWLGTRRGDPIDA
ncbi:sterol desaturase family protein [Alteromonas sp. ASW11-36]|uniref:Sterol desaturase family protein n=1 Tax=Alteromonas arenosi TaxID=3055817 RepID=A0ABT7T0M4_9ALTE|nr:sterol desaturase family protein [Alteromonas sp. ASW11-36]MDM7861998.1 sterol desaturase family protein [Alteromonas sp. ASW11-36]